MLEALSWMARGAAGGEEYRSSGASTRSETYRALAVTQLKKRPLDREPHLPIALGAAIEVEANVLATRGQRTEAVTYLQDQLKTYYATSIRTRIQKNINLLTPGRQAARPRSKTSSLRRASRCWCSSGRTGAATVKPKFRSWRA